MQDLPTDLNKVLLNFLTVNDRAKGIGLACKRFRDFICNKDSINTFIVDVKRISAYQVLELLPHITHLKVNTDQIGCGYTLTDVLDLLRRYPYKNIQVLSLFNEHGSPGAWVGNTIRIPHRSWSSTVGLTSLDVRDWDCVMEELSPLAAFPDLEFLRLQTGSAWTKETFASIATYCPKVKHLVLFGRLNTSVKASWFELLPIEKLESLAVEILYHFDVKACVDIVKRRGEILKSFEIKCEDHVNHDFDENHIFGMGHMEDLGDDVETPLFWKKAQREMKNAFGNKVAFGFKVCQNGFQEIKI